jgi:hypothetical protein
MKSGVENAFMVLSARSLYDRAGMLHLTVRGGIEFSLHGVAIPLPDLAAHRLGIFREDEIGLFAVDDGFDLCIK